MGSSPITSTVAHPVLLVARRGALGAVAGVVSGLAAGLFLVALEAATDAFDTAGWLLFLLPVAGLAVGLAYHYGGGRAAEGNNLLLDEVHEPTAWVPRRMAPMVLVGTVLTHLCGGSAGREGTAVQMAGSLTDGMSRALRLDPEERRLLLVAALAGGFGAVFGVPFAGVVFGLEVPAQGRVEWRALVPATAASFVGSAVVDLLGVTHTPTPDLGRPALTALLVGKVALAAVAFGCAATVFTRAVHLVRRVLGRLVAWPPARPVVGGVAVVALTLTLGTRAYNGLSLPLVSVSFFGDGPPTWAFALKVLLTAVTLGAGFVGGEVTPLFVVGATLGATLAGVLDVPVPLLAALGFVATFGAAANTPMTCVVMGMELFGAGAAPHLVVACVVAWWCSPHEGIYHTQRVHRPKPLRRRPGGPLPSAP